MRTTVNGTSPQLIQICREFLQKEKAYILNGNLGGCLVLFVLKTAKYGILYYMMPNY